MTGGYWRLEGVKRNFRRITRGYRVLQQVTKGYKKLQEVTGAYKGL